MTLRGRGHAQEPSSGRWKASEFRNAFSYYVGDSY
jgi:hypothetical protein